jgi:hypothetical protein
MNNKINQGAGQKSKTDNKLSFSDYEQRLLSSKNNKKGKYASISANANVLNKKQQPNSNSKSQRSNIHANNNKLISSINSYG